MKSRRLHVHSDPRGVVWYPCVETWQFGLSTPNPSRYDANDSQTVLIPNHEGATAVRLQQQNIKDTDRKFIFFATRCLQFFIINLIESNAHDTNVTLRMQSYNRYQTELNRVSKGREMHTIFWVWETLNGIDYSEDIDGDGTINLEWILEKQGGKVWIGRIWLRTTTSRRLLWTR